MPGEKSQQGRGAIQKDQKMRLPEFGGAGKDEGKRMCLAREKHQALAEERHIAYERGIPENGTMARSGASPSKEP